MILQNDCTLSDKGFLFLYLLLNYPNLNNQIVRQMKIVHFDQNILFFSQLYLVASHFSWVYPHFMEIVQEGVH